MTALVTREHKNFKFQLRRGWKDILQVGRVADQRTLLLLSLSLSLFLSLSQLFFTLSLEPAYFVSEGTPTMPIPYILSYLKIMSSHLAVTHQSTRHTSQSLP